MEDMKMKTSVAQLEGANSGIYKSGVEQISASRNVTQDGFYGGRHQFKFTASGTRKWVPSKSYMRLKITITDNADGQLDDAALTAPAMNLAPTLYQAGEFRIGDIPVSKTSDFFTQIDTLETRLSKSDAWLKTSGASTNFWEPVQTTRLKDISSDAGGRSLTTFEVIWQPKALSIFKVDSPLSGNMELILDPVTSSTVLSAALESTGAARTAADTKITVEDVHFYAHIVEGDRFDNGSYLIDLESTRCQADALSSSNFSQRNFDVSPSTNALTVVYQDTRAGTDSRASPNVFRSWDPALAVSGVENALTRFYINYDGMNKPASGDDLEVKGTADYGVQKYLETQLASGAYFDNGGAEDLETFRRRGMYIHEKWDRDGSSRSTRVTVHQGFAAGTSVANVRCLLFDHYRQVARVNMQNGQVTSVTVEDR